MHLLATASGVIDGGAEAIDLKQPPGDIVILTAADSELACLAMATDSLEADFPSVRLANLLHLQHNYAVDLYTEQTLTHAKLIVVRLLGGESYWPYGMARLRALADEKGVLLATLPGGTEADPALLSFSTIQAAQAEKLRQYLSYGGVENTRNFLFHCGNLIGRTDTVAPAAPMPNAGIYRELSGTHQGQVGMVFYRSVIEGGQTAPIDQLCLQLKDSGLGVSALYVSSLKDPASAELIHAAWGQQRPDVIINATAFAVGDEERDPLAGFDCPVLQVTLAGSSEEHWKEANSGLNAKDLVMSVVLPELDGRIATRAISFKSDLLWHERTQCRIVTYRPVADRVALVTELAARWVRLRKMANRDKRIAIVLANYPIRDGRIANGVGYDTPASTIAILKALAVEGYETAEVPVDGNALIAQLMQGPTNQTPAKPSIATLLLAKYESYFNRLLPELRQAVEQRWGHASKDPFFRDGHFHLPFRRYGKIVVGIQPARGYSIDPKTTYHDPALVPPHGYLAFYVWLREVFAADAVINNGKHGNLEWLPGKANALSAACWPEAAVGPIPLLYPFIVNDPGEGTQAKRRTSAVIIDHLVPPLTRAETYGPLKDLEALVDEYYLASGLDHRRLTALKADIIALSRHHRIDADAGFGGSDDDDLQRLDAYLCDLKEAQIRDGLHVLGSTPQGQQETDLLVALTRVPRGTGENEDQSLIRALAQDLSLDDFDPLAADFKDPWKSPKPAVLRAISDTPWRTAGDTVERLEVLAQKLVRGEDIGWDAGPATKCVLAHVFGLIQPKLRSCGTREMAALIAGLEGKRVSPGPSGAPTRGRLDVLPTGRNFFSLDNRSLPTPAAWNLGKRSAEALLKRHFQDTGQHLVAIGLSAWGTANMRTGGDDIAQLLALIGVRPKWDSASWRATGFEVLTLAELGRPRVDVTLRMSGLFRDAFPQQIELIDKAIAAVCALDEPEHDNPLAARTRTEQALLMQSGIAMEDALALARQRIFGSKPGAYGAGLQALMDEGIWQTRSDLAAAYVTWGAYAYGARTHGLPATDSFKARLSRIEAVIHNQDNREHDLLDSDDYYQFEGGMSAAVEAASGKKPRTYHSDHSRPERPVVRTLDEEVARVMRSRVVNPKWINGVKRHGYKGAFEIAATVDYMFAFAATADAVKSHHFDLAYDAFLGDAATKEFLARNNPAALREIAAKLEDAIARGFWQPRLNSAHDLLKELQA